MEKMNFIYDDGGRSRYFKGREVGDCVCRAVAIASGKDYKEIYQDLKKAVCVTPRNGVITRSVKFRQWMTKLGFTWGSCSGIGGKQAVHFVLGELPRNKRLVCSVTKHYVAVVNDEVHDTWDSRYNSWNELRRIYGYWVYNE